VRTRLPKTVVYLQRRKHTSSLRARLAVDLNPYDQRLSLTSGQDPGIARQKNNYHAVGYAEAHI